MRSVFWAFFLMTMTIPLSLQADDRISEIQAALGRSFRFDMPKTPQSRDTLCANALESAGETMYRVELARLLTTLDIHFTKQSTVGTIVLALAHREAGLGDSTMDDMRRTQIDAALSLLGVPEFTYVDEASVIQFVETHQMSSAFDRIVQMAISGRPNVEPVHKYSGRDRRRRPTGTDSP